MYQHTSALAYASLTNLGARQYQVLEALNALKTASNLDLSRYLELPINQVTPRTNELVKAGLVREEFKAHHEVTGKKVIYWGLSQDGQRLFKKKSLIPWGQIALL